ncbi:MAG: hypothetical protein E6J90_43350 [Deltaproteobacteria bacterium]|nr:MAG: hypothetical protein E6J90_43350 [Deltaproteobacteria bacterium]
MLLPLIETRSAIERRSAVMVIMMRLAIEERARMVRHREAPCGMSDRQQRRKLNTSQKRNP